jgi:hypothetical protein
MIDREDRKPDKKFRFVRIINPVVNIIIAKNIASLIVTRLAGSGLFNVLFINLSLSLSMISFKTFAELVIKNDAMDSMKKLLQMILPWILDPIKKDIDAENTTVNVNLILIKLLISLLITCINEEYLFICISHLFYETTKGLYYIL